MLVLAVLVIARDLQLLGRFDYWNTAVRIGPAAATICLFVVLARDDVAAVGARFTPLPSWRFWLRVVIAVAAIFALLVVVTSIVVLALHQPIPLRPPHTYLDVWLPVVDAPFLEETIYRWVLVTALAAFGARWTAVAISGAVFAYLHFVYGSAGPDNFIGGYFFAWMYLRSGSILMPIGFHALGNGSLLVLNLLGSLVVG